MDSNPVIVLVPGAFHRPSVWGAVAQSLGKAGYTVLSPGLTVCGDLSSKTPGDSAWADLADKGPQDDVAVIHEALIPFLDQGREAVIVSHSYGSLPATLAVEGQTVAERAARGLPGGIKGFVTIAGFAYPVRGKGIAGDESVPPLMPYHTLDNGIVHLGETAKPLWYSDLTQEAQDAAWADLFKSQSRKSFLLFPQYIASDIKVPKTYVLTEEDKAVDPTWQAMFVKNGGFDAVVRLKSGHTPLLSMPDKVVEVIIGVASG